MLKLFREQKSGAYPKKRFTRREVITGAAVLAASAALQGDIPLKKEDDVMRENGLEKKKDSFEQRFSRREYIPTEGNSIEVVDIAPEKPTDKVPVLIAPGWGLDIEVYKAGMHILFDKRRRVLGVKNPAPRAQGVRNAAGIA